MDRMEGLNPAAAPPSPYDAPEVYDRIYGGLDFDGEFWLEVARRAGGPVLELGCGTGRILLRLLEAGLDADGVDGFEPMIRRAREKAAARGFAPRLVTADMTDFTLPRRYARVICPFNGFAHAATVDDQIRTLRCCREHLDPGGALVLHLSHPDPDYWMSPDGEPVLEHSFPLGDGGRIEVWDRRWKDRVGQSQRSEMEVRELDPHGVATASRRFVLTQRWVYRYELELLLRLAGFHRWEVRGGFAGEPFERADQEMVAWGWRD
jgi:SAM-dependent methyltransferase